MFAPWGKVDFDGWIAIKRQTTGNSKLNMQEQEAVNHCLQTITEGPLVWGLWLGNLSDLTGVQRMEDRMSRSEGGGKEAAEGYCAALEDS